MCVKVDGEIGDGEAEWQEINYPGQIMHRMPAPINTHRRGLLTISPGTTGAEGIIFRLEEQLKLPGMLATRVQLDCTKMQQKFCLPSDAVSTKHRYSKEARPCGGRKTYEGREGRRTGKRARLKRTEGRMD
ncbi:uncharacterized protein LOC125764872 isoform X2 [Anopheles funestus]|uniref:uncharacterized protein LOC125761615 isoform X2 n=1 Tax=Anopheles funestus TaxID=62324 RepID=UPI0020C614E8|nr:uncharacterized protein LOC125761615 isoform X2 [Anopheles funestus]XP_049285463.1 uncharacterized protein LOC125764872 isoform X2 [Anopheles funestus]